MFGYKSEMEQAYADGVETGLSQRRVHRKTQQDTLIGSDLEALADASYSKITISLGVPYFFNNSLTRIKYVEGFIDGYQGQGQRRGRGVGEEKRVGSTLTPTPKHPTWVDTLFGWIGGKGDREECS